ncbi:MAG: hypothetical protein B7733_11485 [Myxococcales bacterium FL481]|nr:MAG: hypothetical protein B7733_11485 [Myxococcales bacterium FL481]
MKRWGLAAALLVIAGCRAINPSFMWRDEDAAGSDSTGTADGSGGSPKQPSSDESTDAEETSSVEDTAAATSDEATDDHGEDQTEGGSDTESNAETGESSDDGHTTGTATGVGSSESGGGDDGSGEASQSGSDSDTAGVESDSSGGSETSGEPDTSTGDGQVWETCFPTSSVPITTDEWVHADLDNPSVDILPSDVRVRLVVENVEVGGLLANVHHRPPGGELIEVWLITPHDTDCAASSLDVVFADGAAESLSEACIDDDITASIVRPDPEPLAELTQHMTGGSWSLDIMHTDSETGRLVTWCLIVHE